MAVAAVDRRALAARPLPVGARHVLPPVAEVVEVDRARGLAEDERAGDEQLGVGVRVERRVERPLGDRDVAGLAHEAAELRRRDGVLVHPEAVDRDMVDGPLLRVEVVGAHRERAARGSSAMPGAGGGPGEPSRRRCGAIMQARPSA